MVYKKYIKRNGKVFGPYYYESYREDGKVKTRFVSGPKKEDKFSRKKFLYLFFVILVVVLIVAGININFGKIKDLVLLQPEEETPPEEMPEEELPPEETPPEEMPEEELPPEETPPEEMPEEELPEVDPKEISDVNFGELDEGEEMFVSFTEEGTIEYLKKFTSINYDLLIEDGFECDEFSECKTFYNSDNINTDNVALRGVKEMVCTNKNNGVEITQRVACVPAKSVVVKKVGETLEVYDFDTDKLVAKIEIVGNNKLDIEFSI